MSDRPPPNPDSSLDEAAFEIPAPSLSDDDDDDDDIIGKIIDGRYQVESLIGAGGMGFVYMTMHVQLGQRYVLKTLRPELMSSESSRERFLREARSTSMIRHPHVVDVKDFGVHPTFGAYYVMERLEGRDLEQIMREGKRIEPRRAVRIARQVASALGEAHAQGIIHRDLKPANVFLLEPSGDPDHVKVLDFGLARVMDANRRLTETGQVIGTPRYMAPEQCAGERVDARADVYSAGLILWEMLTGIMPFEGLGTYEILGKKMFEGITPPSALNPPVELEPELERVLMRCLEKDPALRPQNGKELAAELARWEEGVSQSSGVRPRGADESHAAPSPAEPMPAPIASPVARSSTSSSRTAWFALLGGAVVIGGTAVAIVALYFATRDPRTTDLAESGRATPIATPDPVPVPDPVEREPRADPPPEVPLPQVTLASEPAGARVFLGERELGVTPITLSVGGDVPEGARVRIALDGYAPREILVTQAVPSAHVTLHR